MDYMATRDIKVGETIWFGGNIVEVSRPGISFSGALARMKCGEKFRRSGWNGKGMWVKYIPFATINCFDSTSTESTLPFIAMQTVKGDIVPWLASQTDLLSDDWEVAS